MQRRSAAEVPTPVNVDLAEVSGPLPEAVVLPVLAPFYIGPAANFAMPTTAHPLPTAIPRFVIVDPKVIVVKSLPGASAPWAFYPRRVTSTGGSD